jgi:hypothetical protein
VQGELWVTGRSHCHFYGWHPEIEPFHLVVGRDAKVMAALDESLPKFLNMVAQFLLLVNKRQSVIPVIDWESVE